MPTVPIEWFVVADDRTGALEAAGMCADALGIVHVVVGHPSSAPRQVVDIGTRHLAAAAAVARMRAAVAVDARYHLHKIDSLLRGNWAHELAARAEQCPVLLVPAFPALGRTCRDGVVRVGGVELADAFARDARQHTVSSRPADHLRDAGTATVVELRAGDVHSWLAAGERGVAVCDADTDDDLHAAAAAWRAAPGVVLAGTAAAIGAAAGVVGAHRPAPPPAIVGPVLVVCGSLHETARLQVAEAERRAAAAGIDLIVLSAPAPDSLPVPEHAAQRVAKELADAAGAVLASGRVGTLAIVGGDTAAAVLGDAELIVGGTVATGVPWARPLSTGPLIITKAGSFGSAGTLADLLVERSSA